MIQLQKSRVVVDLGEVAMRKSEFREKHCVVVPKLLEPTLLDYLKRRLESGRWCTNVNEGVGFEVILDDAPARGLLHFGVNSPAFMKIVEEIGDCGPLSRFEGRVYRFIPNSGHHATWHGDNENGAIGMSVNLSECGYEGGLFQMREKESKRILAEVANTGWGDALLFRISNQLQHQVTEVIGEKPKTAFAGWFSSSDPIWTGDES